jgi:hypothetical protein
MEYIDSPVLVGLDKVPRHCRRCEGALWRAHVCPKCGRVTCGGCEDKCTGCHVRLKRCHLVDKCLSGCTVAASRDPISLGGNQHFRYVNEAAIAKDEIPTMCDICVSAIRSPQQCSSCGNVICGECAHKTADRCPTCRCEPAEWCGLPFLEDILSANRVKCPSCRKVLAFDAEHHCKKKPKRSAATSRVDDNAMASVLLSLFFANRLS